MKAMRSPGFLLAVVLLQAGLIAGLVADSMLGVRTVPMATAQMIPDPAGEQIRTNEILRQMDAKLGKIQAALDGEIKVKVSNPDDKNR
jgi:hypothetical protein